MKKLLEVCCYETAYQVRRPLTWAFMIALFAITMQISLEGFADSARNGGIFLNSSFNIDQLTIMTSVMALLAAASFTGDAGARDAQSHMAALVYTSSVSKAAYLGGRFLAAFLLSALVQLAVPLALMLSIRMPGVGADVVGPFHVKSYLSAYFVIALPNAFVATALFFSVAAMTRRAVVGYLGTIITFFLMIFAWQMMAIKLGKWELAKLIDPIGLTTLAEYSRTTTPREKNVVSLSLTWLLWNRVLWIGIATVSLGALYSRFRFEHVVAKSWRRKKVDDAPTDFAAAAVVLGSTRAAPAKPVEQLFGVATSLRQVRTIAWRSFREVAFSWGGVILLAMTAALVVLGPTALNHMGIPQVPTTRLMATWVGNRGELLWMIIPLITIFYVGELVWREREAGLNEIADATPVREWVRFAGKYAGLALVFLAYHLLLLAACMSIQLQMGYTQFELPLYAKFFLGIQLTEHLMFALLVFAVHVLVNQKYAGHMVTIMVYAFLNLAGSMGVEHQLLVFGSNPGWEYSDLRKFGPFMTPFVWFKLYWAAWTVLLGVLITLLWVRGRENTLSARLAGMKHRFSTPARGVAATAALLVVTLGGFIFYNTNVLNAYDTARDVAGRQVEYEQRYARFKDIPQPSLVGTKLRIELYPERRKAEIRATYSVVNNSRVPIDSIHLATESEVETGVAEFNRPASRVLADDRLNYHIYALQTPLAPGDSLQFSFTVRFEQHGFTNTMLDASVSESATYFEGNDWLPSIGYQTANELGNISARKVAGLPIRTQWRSLEDTAALSDMRNAAAINFEAVIGTTAGQTAVAPGALRKKWMENGRAYFHYATDAPIRNDFSIYSANYASREAQSDGVLIQVFHYPGHALGVDRMIESVKASLALMSKTLGPYPYRQLRLVEHPGEGLTLHASPINISYEEEFPLLNAAQDSRNLEFPFAVVAHELGHQWWGNRLTPAPVEGAALLTESLAWYSSMSVVRATYGDEHLERLLALMREEYLMPRSRADVPLLRATDRFAAYRKGPFAMSALREYVGHQRIDQALGALMQKFGSGKAPLATSLDLYRELKQVTPDSLQYLLTDLFENNTFWELKTKEVTARPLDGGQWRVSVNVSARKVVVDTIGIVTPMPMNDLVEIGVYAPAVDGKRGKALYQRMHRIRAGEQQIEVTVAGEPGTAGIDPRNWLIDTKVDDNVKDVTRAPAGAQPAPGGSL